MQIENEDTFKHRFRKRKVWLEILVRAHACEIDARAIVRAQLMRFDMSTKFHLFIPFSWKERCMKWHMSFFEIDAVHNGTFDVVIEQTFFCAISPEQRTSYVSTVARALKQGGMLAGLFYHTGEEGGPPFNTTREDIVKHFSDSFEIRQLTKAEDSAEQRKNKEWLVILIKK